MFRFSQAAAAIGVTEAALRNWMTRNNLDLFDARPAGGWRTFSERDIFVLAIAAELIRFNAPVRAAVEAARTGLGDMNFKTLAGMPNHLFAAPNAHGWDARTDEGLVRATSGSHSILKINVPKCLHAARLRLDAVVPRSSGEPA